MSKKLSSRSQRGGANWWQTWVALGISLNLMEIPSQKCHLLPIKPELLRPLHPGHTVKSWLAVRKCWSVPAFCVIHSSCHAGEELAVHRPPGWSCAQSEGHHQKEIWQRHLPCAGWGTFYSWLPRAEISKVWLTGDIQPAARYHVALRPRIFGHFLKVGGEIKRSIYNTNIECFICPAVF